MTFASLSLQFKVTFTDFVLEGHMSNCFDKLQIYNGGYFISSYRSVFCGQTLPPPITSQQNTMQIVFTSDFADPWKGFRLEYEPV
ncbi:tolloid-like protein 2 [Rana temporaria]|uniref:tolloid-like protein 2 n=1 Tax=Rana temporaria TaxID=8407 RepID=UPI001AAD229A|nr:tolloid-like protein 2 [Rana temporaria]